MVVTHLICRPCQRYFFRQSLVPIHYMSADLSLPMRSGNQVRRSSLARLHLAADDSSTKCGNAVQPEKETYTIVTVNRGAKYHEQPWGFCTGRRKKKAKCSLHGTFGRPRERRQECGSCRETQPPPPPSPGSTQRPSSSSRKCLAWGLFPSSSARVTRERAAAPR